MSDYKNKIEELDKLRHPKAIHNTARDLIAKSIRIVPLPPGTKAGINPNQYNEALRKAEAVDKWFAPGNPKAGWNLGVGCGLYNKETMGGLTVVDVDVKGNANGMAVISEWMKETEGKMPETITVQTPSGGMHYYFKFEPRLRNCSLPDMGIDIKSGSDNVRSHVVCPPSTFIDENGEEKKYTWVNPPDQFDVGEMPEWLLDKLIIAGAHAQNLTHKFPALAEKYGIHLRSNSSREISLEVLENILTYIDPDLEYEKWIKVGMAIHSQYPDDGEGLWEEWSKQGKKYEEGKCGIHWLSFKKRDDGIGIGTLIHYAQQGGYKVTKEDFPKDSINYGKYLVNEQYAHVMFPKGVKLVRFDSEGTMMVHNKGEARDCYAHMPFFKNDGKRVNPFDVWFSWEYKPLYEGVGMYPPPLLGPDNCLNLWNGFPVEPIKGNVEKFKEFILEVICFNDEKVYEWVIQWLAQVFQFPGEKLGTALVLQGTQGIGKGTLGTVLRKLVPKGSYKHMTDTDTFTGRFNSFMVNNLVMFVDEALWSGNHKHANKLKGMITEDHITVEMKGVDVFSTVNFSRIIIATNNEWAVPADKDSRRYCVLSVNPKYKGNMDYWKSFNDWFDKNLSAVMNFLVNEVKVDKAFLRKPPETEALLEQRRMTFEKEKDKVFEVLMAMLRSGKAEKAPNDSNWSGRWFWRNSYLREAFKKEYPYEKEGHQFPRKIVKLLKKCGVELEQGELWIKGKGHRIKILPESPRMIAEKIADYFDFSQEEKTELASEWTEDKQRF